MDRGDAGRLRDDARSVVSARFRVRTNGTSPGTPLTTLRLTVEYDGTEFSGFQWQPALRTVAGVLEAALSRLFEEPVKVTAAGRTDAGVHATGQVVSFSTEKAFPFERLAVAMASLLPRDCSVREAAVVDDAFSARFSALERTYIYVVLNCSARSALRARYVYHVRAGLSLDAMREAAGALIGERDFRSFSAARADEPTVRTVRRLSIEAAGELVRIEIAADGFLHRMVRTIAGTLVECGLGRRPPAGIPALLRERDRAAAGHTAPAAGLYLAGVRYGGFDSFADPPILARKAGPVT